MTRSTGKITKDTFRQSIWSKTGAVRNEIKIGPRYGTDVSVVEIQHGLSMASASDPLSLIPTLGLAESAWLSVHLTANDLATTGHAPMYGQFVLNLPTWLTDTDFQTYWHHIHSYCKDIGLSITGGHTGRVPGQESTIVGGATFSLVAPSGSILTSDLAGRGQCIILTKGCAISSTAILAMSFPETTQHAVGQNGWQQLCEQFYKTSVLADGLAAYASGYIRAMHDVTEGGVVGAVQELCYAAECGATIRLRDLPISEPVQRVADKFGFDPIRVVGAGAMLITCSLNNADAVIRHLQTHHVEAFAIGHTTSLKEEVVLLHDDGKQELLATHPTHDPYWEAYYQALEKGWK